MITTNPAERYLDARQDLAEYRREARRGPLFAHAEYEAPDHPGPLLPPALLAAFAVVCILTGGVIGWVLTPPQPSNTESPCEP